MAVAPELTGAAGLGGSLIWIVRLFNFESLAPEVPELTSPFCAGFSSDFDSDG